MLEAIPKLRPVGCNHESKMFSSSNSRNPFPYTDDEENPNSKHEQEPPSMFSHFPSPFLDNDDDLLVDHLMSQQHFLVAQAESGINVTTNTNEGTTSKAATATERTVKEAVPKKRSNGAKKQSPRKRTGKKDRHSKICTAQGLRDRRMRLSLQIARKFFDLQDMLGFDKASKTIEWLFTKSKAAIKELAGNLPQINKYSGSGGGKNETGNNGGQKGVGGSLKDKTNDRKSLAKESREKARARARERTMEKIMIRSLEKSKQCSDTNPNNLERGGSSSHYETGEESGSRSQEMNSSLEVAAEVEGPRTRSLEHQMATIGIIEKFLGMANTSRSPSIFDYSCNVAVSNGIISNNDFLAGLAGDWDMHKARIHSSYCAMTNLDPSTGNVQEQNLSSSFMPSSNICLQSQLLENQLSCNPLDANNNRSLF
ncbi:hypothetical protein L1049_007189 [Liquidambar formosana]|uniref:Uncharacterized protein n=1 Tax=Liquidambar formosana TaxID=63359 RepID=A0AAP0WV32_LIQFO